LSGVLGISWLQEMDSLELIEKYVEAGYGLGLSVRLPDKKQLSKVKAIELAGFPPVKLGLLHQGESTAQSKVRHTFITNR
jgi:hypothetical protein